MSPETNETTLHAFVHGRVQGVGFRAYVLQRCVALGLRCRVRNLSDGRSVEVEAEGSLPGLEQLANLLRIGPPGSHVLRVDVRWGERAPEGIGWDASW